ncbi:MAG: class I SAM-dependent methyltransferase [Microcoleus sp. PH2017_29_MFU_D_A]|uniref:class I SAM-dependent methyltransferase n=1 Tax=unclassified Microcoleus TaxID=2642155 RepID=UPI001D9BA3A1|nr:MULTISPECIES: class I SAM-dependent methyltransferase [unclassified Microcoleus]MCC3590998.1 class I SAM-dependent methyltransferase [Microcoleus sp. PH2017_28_MFU_U_A]MCC3603752.1 class I SAM-dependent methyltransferase [Microcoleus sp. PH2017_29_MFU_D_A]MCC3634801.1 class I SAM-dependent methyltransferase [Microcoleus sp. PH2017_37_MFU_D_B]
METNNKYQLIQDPEYSFLRINPVPTEAEVERFYLDEFYSGEYSKFNDSDLSVQQKDREFFHLRWQFIHDQCSDILGSLLGKKLLDIGCGYCQALLYFRDRGLSVHGIEPSREGYEYGLSQGIKMVQRGIEGNDIKAFDERFDIVTLLNVLEHLRNPAEALKRIRSDYLAKGGVLVIDVPNEFNDFQTSAKAEHRLQEWWVCPPNHLNYFSPTSLKALLQSCGYQVVHIEASFPLEMFLLWGDVYVGNGVLGAECHQKRVRFEQVLVKHGKLDKLRAFYAALADLELGRQITVYAVPIESSEV